MELSEEGKARLTARFHELMNKGLKGPTLAMLIIVQEEVERALRERPVFEVSSKVMTALFASREDADAFIGCLPPSVGGGLVPYERPMVKPDVLGRG